MSIGPSSVMMMMLGVAACSLSAATYQGGDTTSDAGTTDSPNDPHGGTRLQLGRYVFEDVSRVATIHDVVLDLDCAPATWSDGKQRCTPPTQTFVAFGDAACTQPIGVDSPGTTCNPQGTVFVVDQAADASIHHLYTRGAALPGSVWYTNQSGTCQQQGLTGWELFRLGSEIAPDTLAEVTDVPTPIGGFTVHITRSADGLQLARSNYLLHDNTYDTECYIYPDGNKTVCNPYPVAEASVFTDAQCTSPEAVVVSPGTLPITLVRDGRDSCTGASYSRLGGPAPPASLWELDPTSTCMPATPNPTSSYYTIGAPAPLPEFTRVAPPTSARIQSGRLVSGALHVDDTLYDTTLGVACSPLRTGDGIVRCVPTGDLRTAFTDSNCQQSINVIAVIRTSTCVDPIVPPYVAAPGLCAADGYKVGQRYTGPVYFGVGDSCQQIDTGFEYYLATTHVPDTTFATGTYTIGQ